MSFKSYLYGKQLSFRERMAARAFAKRKVAEIDLENFQPGNLLFVLSGLIGDSVMCLPTIAEARRVWPDALITVLGRRHNKELIAACPFFDEFYECNADPFSLRRSAEITKLGNWLKVQKFDAAVILLGSQYAHLLARAKIPVRVGLKGSELESCLTKTYDIGSPRTWGADEKLNSIRTLGVSVDRILPKITVDVAAKESMEKKLSDLGHEAGESYVVFHPFGSTARQWLGTDKILPLAEAIYAIHGLKSVLIGGEETQVKLDLGTTIIDTRGKLSLPELLAAIDGSELVVTTDSGPFHIAGALGKRIVGLFRSRRPEHAAAYPNTKIVFGSDDRCKTECDWDRCAAEPCRQMSEIATSDITAVIESL